MKLDRRNFLKLSAAAGMMAAAGTRLNIAPPLVAAQNYSAAAEEKMIPTTCWIGKQDCGMFARVIDGRVVKFEGHPDHPRNRGTLCVKGQAQIAALYDPYRVKAPLKRINAKGEHGEWQEISWEEALTIVGDRIKEYRAKDPKLIQWQKGRSKAKKFYDTAFVKAVGCEKLHHGAYCSDAGYRACEYTVGFHGVLHPDFKYCNYLLGVGWGLVVAGGNKTCWLTWPRQFLEAKERGMKFVALDPSRERTGPHADEWIPIKPSTDLVFFNALANVLIRNGYVDRDYLLKHTNAPFLVGEDGLILRKAEITGENGSKTSPKELVWDLKTKTAVPYDEALDPALEGEYVVDGSKVKTCFQLYKEHVADYTPEKASRICDVPAETIERIALEMGREARIGSTIVIDGVEVPYRPVGMMMYHVTQQELGFQMCRAALLVAMLLGSIEAAGGTRVDFKRKIDKRYKSIEEIEIKDETNVWLKNSKFYPINSNNSSVAAYAMLNPKKYGVTKVPEMCIIHMAEPLLSFVDQPVMMKAYEKFKFVVAIQPWMTETADLYADIVLPCATIEKYEGPLGVTDQYYDAESLRVPPIQPLFKSRSEIDIYMDLCEKAGVLYGEKGYLDQVNKALNLKGEHKLDLNRKPTVREIFDKYARMKGYPGGIRFFEEKGVKVKPIPPDKYYAPAWEKPYGGIRHRLYGEKLLRLQRDMRRRGVAEIYWRDYTPFPTWRKPTMEGSPKEYDLYLISGKKIEFKQSRTTFIPLLNELEPEQRLKINPRTAREKGIKDGDEVWVESHNALTGETRRIRTKAQYIESLRPDTVDLSHHYGFWVRSTAKDRGPTPNSIFFSGEGYVSNTADQSFQVKVRVYK
jgi:anaerobic selenocysteine-containing dehydrogenase